MESGGTQLQPGPLPAPNAAGARFPCFDGLRAIACGTVLVTHVSFNATSNQIAFFGVYFARMDIGVAIFFLISGFLLYRPFAARLLRGDPMPETGAYFKRRLVRIVPAYWVILTLALFVFRIEPHARPVDMLWYYSFTQIYDKSHVIGGLTQAWSLCTEITFYVFLPGFAAAMAWGTRRRTTPEQRLRAQLVVLGGLYAVSLAFRFWITSRWFGPHGTGFVVGPFHVSWGCANSWLPATLDYFALGMLLAVLQAWSVTADDRWRRRLEALGAHAWMSWSLALVAFWLVSKHAGLPINLATYPRTSLFARQFLYGLVGFFALIPAVFGPQERGLGRRVLKTRAMVWVGTVSYGVYLSHELWIKEFHQWTGIQALKGGFLGMLVFVGCLSVLMASISYVSVERPILGRVRRPAPLPAPPPDVSAAPPTAPDAVQHEAVSVP